MVTRGVKKSKTIRNACASLAVDIGKFERRLIHLQVAIIC